MIATDVRLLFLEAFNPVKPPAHVFAFLQSNLSPSSTRTHLTSSLVHCFLQSGQC